MAKLYAIPGKKEGCGPIHLKSVIITCNKCGNQNVFFGKALVNPKISVERTGVKKYEVTEIAYKSDESVDEVIEVCGMCNSRDLKFE